MIDKLLGKIGELQQKFPVIFLVFILLVTSVLMFGLPNIEVQSDFSKENPRQLPAYVLTDRIKDEFGGETSVILIFEMDISQESDLVDLRDPSMVNFLIDLEDKLVEDSRVVQVSSVGSLLENMDHETREEVLESLDKIKGSNSLFNDDYSLTMMSITTNIGEAYEDIVPFEEMLNEKIASVDYPGGVNHMLTGGPPFGKVIRETVFADAAKTITIASVGIFLLLLISLRSLRDSILVFLPLVFALVWTGGILGYWGLKLSIACVALGSIVLGLGVEYGVFMLTRYKEERFKKKKSQLESNKSTVINIGQALLGSGTTTIAGFLALTFSITPMMQILGISLAVGIACCILSAILVTPLLLVISENIEKWRLPNNVEANSIKLEFYKKY